MAKTERFMIDVNTNENRVEIKIGCFPHDYPVLQLLYTTLCVHINSNSGILDALQANSESKLHVKLNEHEHSLSITIKR